MNAFVVVCTYIRVSVLFVLFVLLQTASVMADSEQNFWNGVSEVFFNTPCSGASAGAGNAWVADESCNPALLSFETDMSVGAMYHVNRFDNGTDIHAHAESFAYHLPFGGAVQINYYDAFSNHSDSKDDNIGQFIINGSPFFNLQYGTTVGNDLVLQGDRLDIGAGYGYVPDMNVVTNKTQNGYVEARSSEHLFTVGIAYHPTQSITVGAVYSHLRDVSTTIIHPDKIRTPSQSVQQQARLGVAVQFTPETKVKMDVQYLDLGDGVEHKQLFLGAEHTVSEEIPLTIRAGWSSNGPTVGIGYEITDSISVDAAYARTPIRDFDSTGTSEDAVTVSINIEL